MHRRPTLFALVGTTVLTLAAAACASGPSPEAIARDQAPATTTTTVALAEGVFGINISNGAFSPAVLELDIDEFQIIRWENADDVEYVIVSRDAGAFESPPIGQGEFFEFDISTLEPGVHRYSMQIGNNRVPGLIDTRPAQ